MSEGGPRWIERTQTSENVQAGEEEQCFGKEQVPFYFMGEKSGTDPQSGANADRLHGETSHQSAQLGRGVEIHPIHPIHPGYLLPKSGPRRNSSRGSIKPSTQPPMALSIRHIYEMSPGGAKTEKSHLLEKTHQRKDVQAAPHLTCFRFPTFHSPAWRRLIGELESRGHRRKRSR